MVGLIYYKMLHNSYHTKTIASIQRQPFAMPHNPLATPEEAQANAVDLISLLYALHNFEFYRTEKR